MLITRIRSHVKDADQTAVRGELLVVKAVSYPFVLFDVYSPGGFQLRPVSLRFYDFYFVEVAPEYAEAILAGALPEPAEEEHA